MRPTFVVLAKTDIMSVFGATYTRTGMTGTTGSNGSTMRGPPGEGYVYMGAYGASTTYRLLNDVLYDGDKYTYINGTPASGKTPSIETTYWRLSGTGFKTTAGGDWDCKAKKLTNLATCTELGHATTKGYVDGLIIGYNTLNLAVAGITRIMIAGGVRFNDGNSQRVTIDYLGNIDNLVGSYTGASICTSLVKSRGTTDLILHITDNTGAKAVVVKDSDGNTVAKIDSLGMLQSASVSTGVIKEKTVSAGIDCQSTLKVATLSERTVGGKITANNEIIGTAATADGNLCTLGQAKTKHTYKYRCSNPTTDTNWLDTATLNLLDADTLGGTVTANAITLEAGTWLIFLNCCLTNISGTARSIEVGLSTVSANLSGTNRVLGSAVQMFLYTGSQVSGSRTFPLVVSALTKYYLCAAPDSAIGTGVCIQIAKGAIAQNPDCICSVTAIRVA